MIVDTWSNNLGHLVPDMAPVDLIVCYCQEDLDWLTVLWKLPWTEDDHSEMIKGWVNLRMVHKCPQFGEEKERKRLLDRWAPHFRNATVEFIYDDLRADDCTAYLGYISNHYDELTRHTFFLHADVGEHIPHLNMLTDTVLASVQGFINNLNFAHLAHNFVRHAPLPGS